MNEPRTETTDEAARRLVRERAMTRGKTFDEAQRGHQQRQAQIARRHNAPVRKPESER